MDYPPGRAPSEPPPTSIRISGFRLRSASFAEADALVRAFRAEIAPLHREAIARHLVAKALERHDLHRTGLVDAPDGTALGAAFQGLDRVPDPRALGARD